jgi:hypothetical protein
VKTTRSHGNNGLSGEGLVDRTDQVLKSISALLKSNRANKELGDKLFPDGIRHIKVTIKVDGLGEVVLDIDGNSKGADLQGLDTFLFLDKRLAYKDVRKLISNNNKSINQAVTPELLTALIWKESGFRPDITNSSTTATGLMQLTKAAVDDVNNNTPSGIHFDHKEMIDPAKNIQCGTYYLDLRIKRADGNLKKGLEGFGTGAGYADDILVCQDCLKDGSVNPQDCLDAIHA